MDPTLADSVADPDSIGSLNPDPGARKVTHQKKYFFFTLNCIILSYNVTASMLCFNNAGSQNGSKGLGFLERQVENRLPPMLSAKKKSI